MSESELKLQGAPIVEAVLDIDCDMPPGQDIASLEGPARERFSDHYPRFRPHFLQEHEVEAEVNKPPPISTRHGVQAFQFLQDDGKQLVQVRAEGFSFNRLAPYTSLDDYLPEIERTWRLYVGLALPIQIRVIRLRYINRILIPMIEGRVQLDDYLKVGPRLPDEDKLSFIGFLNQHAAVEIETGNQVNTVLTTQEASNDKVPLIFDISVSSPGGGEPQDWPWLLAKIRTLRLLKNHIFRNTLTERCLNLFR